MAGARRSTLYRIGSGSRGTCTTSSWPKMRRMTSGARPRRRSAQRWLVFNAQNVVEVQKCQVTYFGTRLVMMILLSYAMRFMLLFYCKSGFPEVRK